MNSRSNLSKSSLQKDVFSNENAKLPEEEKLSTLLKFIKKHPVIYDVNHPNFYQKKFLDAAWAQISSETGTLGLFLFI